MYASHYGCSVWHGAAKSEGPDCRVDPVVEEVCSGSTCLEADVLSQPDPEILEEVRAEEDEIGVGPVDGRFLLWTYP